MSTQPQQNTTENQPNYQAIESSIGVNFQNSTQS